MAAATKAFEHVPKDELVALLAMLATLTKDDPSYRASARGSLEFGSTKPLPRVPALGRVGRHGGKKESADMGIGVMGAGAGEGEGGGEGASSDVWGRSCGGRRAMQAGRFLFCA